MGAHVQKKEDRHPIPQVEKCPEVQASPAPTPAKKKDVTDQGCVDLKGLILVGNKSGLNPPKYEKAQTIEIYNIHLPGTLSSLRNEVIPHFFHQHVTKKSILKLKKAILRYYRDRNRPIVTIQVPEQDISSGVLQLIVTEAEVGEITVRGNKYFKSSRIKDAIDLEPGEPVNSKVLLQDLMWLNRNPFRQVDVVYSPGKEAGTTDIELLVHDRRPWRLYGGVDNTGNDVTGNNRLFAGFNLGNLFWADQILSYQFSTAVDFKRFWAHTLHYTIPLPWKHIMIFYGGYSHVDSKFAVPNVIGTDFRNKGWSTQGSFRYDIPLTPYPRILQEMFFGFDFKRTNNNLEFGGVPVVSNNVNLFQLVLAYNMGFETKKVTTSWEIEGFYSPGRWLSDQSKADYRTLRPFAKPTYFYARTSFSFIWCFSKPLEFHTYFRGQIATTNLLPSEEYGVGGYNTVRGYKERAANGDHAIVYNGEIRTRKASLAQLFGLKPWIDEFQLLGFLDYGIAYKDRAALGERKTRHLLSVGPGIRYNILPYVSFRSDLGFQLKNLEDGEPHRRLHFLLVVSY